MRARGALLVAALGSGGWVCTGDASQDCGPDPGRPIRCSDGVAIETVWCPLGTVAACGGSCFAQPITGCAQNYTCAPGSCSPNNLPDQKWTMYMGADQGSLGNPIGAGDPPESVDVTIAIGTAVTSSCFDQVSGGWYVLDRGGNVVPFTLECNHVSNVWDFMGTAGPGPLPDGLTATLTASGASDADFPNFMHAGGNGSWTVSLNGAGSVTENWVWSANRQ